MIRPQLATAVLAAAAFATTASASQVITDSATLGTTNLAAGPEVVSADGVNVTISAQTADAFMQVDGDGIFLQGAGDLINVTFDADVTVTGYLIGFHNDGTTGNVEFYVDGGTSYFESGVTTGTYALATPLEVDLGSVLTINGNPSDVSQLKGLSFIVPEPSSLALLGGALAFGLARRGRRL